MRRPTLPLRGLALAAAAAAIILPGLSHATLIAVYSRPYESLSPEAAAQVARAAKLDPAAAIDPKFRVKIADHSVLSSDYSVPAGVSAYFWSDETFEPRGFVMGGSHVTFERDLVSLTKGADATGNTGTAPDTVRALPVAASTAWTTRLQGASAEATGLSLAYSLSRPGRVSVEAYTPGGRSVGRWSWEEGSPGSFRRSVTWRQAPAGALLVRWSAGGAQETRAVTGGGGGKRVP